jgi:hypothetical protein
VVRSAADGLVQVYVAVSDLDVKSTFRIYTNPGFVVHGRPLAPVVGQGHEMPLVAFQALRHYLFFHEYLLPDQHVAEYITVFKKCSRLGSVLFKEITSYCVFSQDEVS